MIEKILLVIWGLWLLMILAAAFRTFGFLIARRAQIRRWGDGGGSQKSAALIIPVKGFDLKATPRFFDAILAQNYRNYRVIVCFESWDDPVARWLREHLELSIDQPVWHNPDPESGLRSITLVSAGIATDEGQKVHNQRAAMETLTPNDEIIAFADADIYCESDWLAQLLAPINQGTHPVSTTYRWLVPRRPTLANQVASVINASITTQGGAEWSTVLWGGSMAMNRQTFDQLDVSHLLAGSLNDDLRISKAVHQAKLKIAFVRSLILPTSIDFTWRSFFEFARRQYTQVKFFSPILYIGVNLVLGFYVLAAATIIGALIYGSFIAWVPIAAAYVIDQFRSLARQQVYLTLYKDNAIRRKLFAAAWLEHMLTPAWITLHWCLLASTWTQNRLTWAGVRYKILSKSETQILSRSDAVTPLPAGAPGLAVIRVLRDLARLERHHKVSTTPEPTPEETPVSEPATPAMSEEIAIPVAEEITPVADEVPSAIIPLSELPHHLPGEKSRNQAETIEEDAISHLGPISAVEAVLHKTRLPFSHPAQLGDSTDDPSAIPDFSFIPRFLALPDHSSLVPSKVEEIEPSTLADSTLLDTASLLQSPTHPPLSLGAHRAGRRLALSLRRLPKSPLPRSSRPVSGASMILPLSSRPISRKPSARC